MEKLFQVLESMRLPNGAYIASPSHDYSYVWIRDVGYTVLPYLYTPYASGTNRYMEAYRALLDLFKRYEWKIDIHSRQKPTQLFEYIHARYAPDLTELSSPWGHAQNDAIGLFLWGIGEGIRLGVPVFRDQGDRRIVQKLVDYLSCLSYWQMPDNGMWEGQEEVHASSVGACVAGLKSVRMIVDVPELLISKGEESLNQLLPWESVTKATDLALLSLIYPYHVVSRGMALRILEDITGRLERTYGAIRYMGDEYYNEGAEAEWCFAFPWLGLCYFQLGNIKKAQEYWEKTKKILPENGEIPELYIGGTSQPNRNTPLAWAVALVILLHQCLENEG